MSLESKFFAPNFPFSPSRVPFFYGWVILVASLCSRIISIPAHGVGLGPFTEPLLKNLQISRVCFSNTLLVATLIGALLLPIFGRLIDRIGTRRSATYVSLLLGLALIFLGRLDSIITFFSPWFPPTLATIGTLFFGFFLLKLLGQNLISLLSRIMLLHWYDKKSCTMIGISGIFISIAFGAAPSLTHCLIEKFSYSHAWHIVGISILLVCLPIIWLLCRDTPQQCGMHIDDTSLTPPLQNCDVSAITPEDKTLKQALSSLDFWIFVIATAHSTFTTAALQIHIVDIFREANACISNAFDIFLPMSVVSALFGLIFSIFQDKISIKYCLIAVFLTNSLIMFSLENISHMTGLACFVCLCGFNWALYGIIHAAPWPKLFGKTHLAHIMSTVSLITVTFSSIAPSCMGYSQQSGSYFYVTRFLFCSSAVGLIISIFYILNNKKLFKI